jgi:hypothetical protein
MKKILISLALMLFAGNVFAEKPEWFYQVSADEYYVFGSGSASCGTWTGGENNNPYTYYQKRSWILGFVSGAGWSNRREYEVDSDGVYAWIDNYCKANPLKYLNEAAEALVLELEK